MNWDNRTTWKVFTLQQCLNEALLWFNINILYSTYRRILDNVSKVSSKLSPKQRGSDQQADQLGALCQLRLHVYGMTVLQLYCSTPSFLSLYLLHLGISLWSRWCRLERFLQVFQKKFRWRERACREGEEIFYMRQGEGDLVYSASLFSVSRPRVLCLKNRHYLTFYSWWSFKTGVEDVLFWKTSR